MACFHPLLAYQAAPGVQPVFVKSELASNIKVPCGRCWGCRLKKATETAVRVVHEQQMTKHHEFITLTFNDKHLPKDWSLDHRYWQLFMKKVRKLYGKGPRYVMCGEYGDNLGRPHFHAIMFNFPLKDKKLLFSDSGRKYYTSDTLQRLWSVRGDPLGHVMTTDVTFASAQYVARYVTKKINGKSSDEHYTVMICETGEIVRLKSEYAKYSTDPGIGSSWFDKYGLTDCFPKDYVVVNSGSSPFKVGIPRYYMKKLEKINPELYLQIKARRLERAKELAPDNTPERLLQKEMVLIENARRRLQAEKGRRYKPYEAKDLQYLRLKEWGL